MKKKKWFLVITSILLMLLACTQIQAAAIKAPANIKVTASKKSKCFPLNGLKFLMHPGMKSGVPNSAKGNYSKIKTIKNKKYYQLCKQKNFLQDITITKYVLIKP